MKKNLFLSFFFSLFFTHSLVYAQDWQLIDLQAVGEQELVHIFMADEAVATIESGPHRGKKYMTFAYKFAFTSGCTLYLPKDEGILFCDDKKVVTKQYLYQGQTQFDVSHARIRIYDISTCQLKRVAQRTIPYESTVWVGDQGQLLYSDYYYGFGRFVTIWNDELEEVATDSLSPYGFQDVQTDVLNETFFICFSENKEEKAAKIQAIDLDSAQFLSPIDIPFLPTSGDRFQAVDDGFIVAKFGHIMKVDSTGKPVWDRYEYSFGSKKGPQGLLLDQQNEIVLVDISSGQEKCTWDISKLYEFADQDQDQDQDQDWSGYSAELSYLHQNENGILIVISKKEDTDSLATVSLSTLYKNACIFWCSSTGEILLSEVIQKEFMGGAYCLRSNHITVVLDEKIYTFDLPK